MTTDVGVPDLGAASTPSPRGLLLEAAGFAKSFGTTKALVRGELTVLAGEIHALVGHNGSGKSTFVRTLSGYHEAESGSLIIRGAPVQLPLHPEMVGQLGMAFVHQDLGLIDSLSVLENMCLTRLSLSRRVAYISWRSERSRARADLDALGADVRLDEPVRKLRPVDRAFVAAARAFATLGTAAGRILFCDELTGYLPRQEVLELYRAMRRLTDRGDAVVVVSHDLTEVLEHADRVTVMRNGAHVATLRTDETDVESLTTALLGDAEPVSSAPEPVSTVAVPVAPSLSVDRLSLPGRSEITFHVAHGEILGLTGLVGGGHEEVVEALAGASEVRGGTAAINGDRWDLSGMTPGAAIRHSVGWVPPDRMAQGLITSLPSKENLPMLVLRDYFKAGVIRWGQVKAHTRERAQDLTVSPADPNALVNSLSGGNQQKVLLGKVLERSPRLLLLSEPTRGVDVGARRTLWGLIRSGAGSRCTVWTSTDYAELAEVCDRVLVFRDGRIVRELVRPGLSAEVIGKACIDA